MSKENEYQVLGLMSGTSCDGLDIAHCKFISRGDLWSFDIVHAHTYEYPDTLQKKLRNVISLSALDLAKLDIELGYFMADQVNSFLVEYSINRKDINFISSHGHTVFHQPEDKLTYQIGNGVALNQATRLAVINDYRTEDVLTDGQGAPLVPVGDKILFKEYEFCLNLGGISNVSFDDHDTRIAFDIGPQNLAINLIANLEGLNMDKDGAIAQKGQLNNKLKEKLDTYTYYQKPYPKSLGIENLKEQFFPLLLNSSCSNQDKLHTLYHHLAFQISKAIIDYKKPGAKMLVTGGGAYNHFFIHLLREYLANSIIIEVPQNLIIDFKEALVFAFLGVLRYRKEPNIYKSVTGASQNTCSGVMHGF